MAEKQRRKATGRKSSRKERRQKFEKIGEGLKKELDAIVAPIHMEGKERLGKAAPLGKESPGQPVPEQKTERKASERSESEVATRAKARKRRTYCWGIVIGETD